MTASLDTLRRHADILIQAALQAVDPLQAVRRAVRRDVNSLYIADQAYHLDDYDHIWIVGGGKAGAPMSLALSQILGDRLSGGWVNVKHGHVVNAPLPPGLTIHQARHPIPDEDGRRGAEQILHIARQAAERDLVLCLISGGGSALLPLPAQEIALTDLQALTDALLRCGATINEVNTVRKHCSQIAGGRLAETIAPATCISLILSDVVGNPLDVIASGPTVPDPTTFADAWAVLEKYNVIYTIPPSISKHLEEGLQGHRPETPKPGHQAFARVQNTIIGSNLIAAHAAEAAARSLGLHTLLLSTCIEGEAREVGRVMAGLARSLCSEALPIPRPACLIAGGETTVTVRGSGRGGRNQELALSAALSLDGRADALLVALATDGSDGPTDAAGALADGETVRRAHALGLSAADFLARNDSYTLFEQLDDLIRTGPTNTNVNDLIFILA